MKKLLLLLLLPIVSFSQDSLICVIDNANNLLPSSYNLNANNLKKTNDNKETMNLCVAVGGKVWKDNSRNSLYDNNEPLIEGVNVALYSDDDGDGNPTNWNGAIKTDQNGEYRFSGLDPGKYIVFIWLVDNWGVNEPLHNLYSSPIFSADPNNDIINDNSGPGEQMFDLSFYPKPRGPRDIRSGIIDLSINEEPTNENVVMNVGDCSDSSENMTIDFGFYSKEISPCDWIPSGDGLSEFILALNAMTNHVNDNNLLIENQLINHLNTIKSYALCNLSAAKTEIFDFTDTYEENNPPVFSNNNSPVKFSELAIETQAFIFLQQTIFDEQYTDSNLINMSGIKYEAANHFPGEVNQNAPRVESTLVEIDGNYSYVPGARHLGDTWPAKRPTGYYVAPGELVTITIPNDFIDKELKVKVGVHERDHSNLGETNRFLRISKDYKLDNEITTIMNPFGGGIYILVPEGSSLGSFNITINGAVKAPYFSCRNENETNLSVWQDELASQNVPWADIEGDKFMMTVRSDHLYGNGSINLTDPTFLMQKWDEVADAFNFIGGRPPFRSRAEYIISDSRIPDGSYGTGYPAVYDQNDDGMIPTSLLFENSYTDGGVTTLFHEMGHLEWHPTLNKSIESIVHLPAVYLWNTYDNVPLDIAFKYSAFQRLTMDQTTIDWIMTDNFRNNRPMECDPTIESSVCQEVRYQHRGHAMYVEIAELFGWEAIYNTHKIFYDEWKDNDQEEWNFMNPSNGNSIEGDELILAASNSNQVNMAPLFHFWGLHPSNSIMSQLNSLPNSCQIYNRILHYKSITPDNTEEFKTWYDLNYEPVGGVQQVRYDYALSNYDSDNYSQKINEQIDFIIETYFGDENYNSNGIIECPDNLIQEPFNPPANNFNVGVVGASCVGQSSGKINILLVDQSKNYIASLDGNEFINFNLTKGYSQSFENLSAGVHQVCFSVDVDANFTRCFSLNVTEPQPLSVYSRVNPSKKSVTINMEGSNRYTVKLNGETSIIDSSSSELQLKAGINFLEVYTDQECQGVYTEEIFVSEEVQYYPNPTSGSVQVFVSGEDTQINLSINGVNGYCYSDQSVAVSSSRKIALDLSSFNNGVYIIHVEGPTVSKSFKIIKK